MEVEGLEEGEEVGISIWGILLICAQGIVIVWSSSLVFWSFAKMKFTTRTTLLATAMAAPALAAEYAAEMYASGEIHSQIMETKHVSTHPLPPGNTMTGF